MVVSAPLPALSDSARLLPADLGTLLAWHERYAVNPSSLAAISSMTHMLTLPGVPGGLGIQRTGRVLVASGEPLAPVWAWSALASALLDLCRASRAVPCFAPVGSEFAALLGALGLLVIRLGSTPYIHLQNWPQSGTAGAGVRHARNRARRDGLTFRAFRLPGERRADSPDQATGSATVFEGEVSDLCAGWLTMRQARVPFRWVFRLQPLAFRDRKRYFEARRGGRLVGLIAASRLGGRNSWYLEDIVRTEDAPASTGTALVAYALNTLKEDGVGTATLGGVPLSRERGWEAAAITPLERLAYSLRPLLARLYSFDGLELFKRRFGPAHWEDESLVLPQGLPARLAVGAALARLILRDG